MALKLPLVITAGKPQQLQSGDTIDTGEDLQSLTNSQGSTINIGEAVYSDATGSVKLAKADSANTSQVLGVVYDTTIVNSASGNIRVHGVLTATTGEWDAVTGGSGGLTTGSIYYLDPDTAGDLTLIPSRTAGDTVIQVGIALSTTQMKIQVRERAPRVLTANTTIYVDVSSGSDANSGESGSPFATIKRAFDEFQLWVPGAFTITIDVEDGDYPVSSTLKFRYPYGAALSWEGNVTNYGGTTLTFNNFGTVQTDANFPELEYFDFDVVLPSGTAEAGKYIAVITPSGGSNNQALWGLHRVQTWVLGTLTATVRVWRQNGVTELPSGTITGSGAVIHTVLQMTGDNGIEVEGPYHGGEWNNLVLEGDQDAYDNHSALYVLDQGIIKTGNRLGVHQWEIGMQPFNSGLIEASQSWVAKIQTDGARPQNGGVADVRFGTRFNGCGRSGIYAISAKGFFQSGFMQGCGELFALHAERGSHIDCEQASIYFDDASSTACLHAEDASNISAAGSTVSGWATVKSPAANPGNNSSNIVGP